MKITDLPPLDSIKHPLDEIPQQEIERINNLYAEMRRKARYVLRDAMELGDWFSAIQKKFGRYWGTWLDQKFPKIAKTTIYTFIKLAVNREYIEAISRSDALLSISEASHMISQQRKMDKPRVRAVVVRDDAPPEVMLEAKLKNYVIELWRLRYLQTEIEGLIEAMELKPEQVLKVLRYVSREHHEVEEEVIHTFNPPLKIVSKGA